MLSVEAYRAYLESPQSRDALVMLYGQEAIKEQIGRYRALGERFFCDYPSQTGVRFFSAPGRAEIGGNHTDHQLGRVLAASVDLDTLAAAAPNGGQFVRIHSENYQPFEIDISDVAMRASERETTQGLVRGCVAQMQALGYPVGGFDAVVTSRVASGSGLSSSAAFEVMICAILDGLFGKGDMEPTRCAQICQYAENHYFGKPSGLLDQTASAVGGLVTIDFGTQTPSVRAMQYDFAAKGYALAVVKTGGSHGNLTDAYAAITREMKQVAAYFGQENLRAVDSAQWEKEIPAMRGKVPDRALLRAMHFFSEHQRVADQVAALEADDIDRFLALIIASGDSSWKLLQNLWAVPQEQPLPLALALTERILKGRGAWRVHGGGFAGTILAFVPLDKMEEYRARMDAVFGEGACCPLRIRPVGAYALG